MSNVSPFVGRSISTGSISSCGSAESEPRGNQKADQSANLDAVVAQQALELLVLCLKLRNSHIGEFSSCNLLFFALNFDN